MRNQRISHTNSLQKYNIFANLNQITTILRFSVQSTTKTSFHLSHNLHAEFLTVHDNPYCTSVTNFYPSTHGFTFDIGMHYRRLHAGAGGFGRLLKIKRATAQFLGLSIVVSNLRPFSPESGSVYYIFCPYCALTGWLCTVL